MGIPEVTANAQWEFSRTMNHPSAGNPGAAEVWEDGTGFYEGKIHWTLGHTPSWVECFFHAGLETVFPWTRARLSDELGVIAIFRFDTVTPEMGDMGRVWHAYGRDALYGTVDNFMRSPRIYTEPGATDIDAGYTEWPVITPDKLTSCESILRDASRGNTNDLRYKNCIAAVTCTDVGTPANCTFKTDAARDTALSGMNAESAYSTQANKIGPNYTSKGVRRGWVFKDIHRHTAGSALSESRPILGVYNRSNTDLKSDVIDSDFAQAQAGGSGANALARDVSISWPWETDAEAQGVDQQPGETAPPVNPNTGQPIDPNDQEPPTTTPPSEAATVTESGYDYRHVWPGKNDQFAPSGQALEVFQRGSMAWDDSVCFGCGENTPTGGGCPGGARVCFFVTCAQSNFQAPAHKQFSHFPTRSEAAGVANSVSNNAILGVTCVISIFDSAYGLYNYNSPSRLTEWIGRHNLRQLRVRRTEFTNAPAGPYINRSQPVGKLLASFNSSNCSTGPNCNGVRYSFPNKTIASKGCTNPVTHLCEECGDVSCTGTYDCSECSDPCPPDPTGCLADVCYICPQFCTPCNSHFTNAECIASAPAGCTDKVGRLIPSEAILDNIVITTGKADTPSWSGCNGKIRRCATLDKCVGCEVLLGRLLTCADCTRAAGASTDFGGGALFFWMTPTTPLGIPTTGGDCLGTPEPIAVWTSNQTPNDDFLCYEPLI